LELSNDEFVAIPYSHIEELIVEFVEWFSSTIIFFIPSFFWMFVETDLKIQERFTH
jgi:hypothetical protein